MDLFFSDEFMRPPSRAALSLVDVHPIDTRRKWPQLARPVLACGCDRAIEVSSCDLFFSLRPRDVDVRTEDLSLWPHK